MEVAAVVIRDKNNKVVSGFKINAAGEDFIRAVRLKRLADKGDKQAAQELMQMENDEVYLLDFSNNNKNE